MLGPTDGHRSPSASSDRSGKARSPASSSRARPWRAFEDPRRRGKAVVSVSGSTSRSLRASGPRHLEADHGPIRIRRVIRDEGPRGRNRRAPLRAALDRVGTVATDRGRRSVPSPTASCRLHANRDARKLGRDAAARARPKLIGFNGKYALDALPNSPDARSPCRDRRRSPACCAPTAPFENHVLLPIDGGEDS